MLVVIYMNTLAYPRMEQLGGLVLKESRVGTMASQRSFAGTFTHVRKETEASAARGSAIRETDASVASVMVEVDV